MCFKEVKACTFLASFAQSLHCAYNVMFVQDLTQFNTAHNRQISMVGIPETEVSHKRKQHPLTISFADEEEIINPEDIDPTIGKFRNMVQTTIIPTKVIYYCTFSNWQQPLTRSFTQKVILHSEAKSLQVYIGLVETVIYFVLSFLNITLSPFSFLIENEAVR